MFEFKSMKTRLTVILVGVSVLTTLCVGGFFINNIVQDNKAQLINYRQDQERAIEEKLRSDVVARRFCPCLAQDICQKLLPCFAA